MSAQNPDSEERMFARRPLTRGCIESQKIESENTSSSPHATLDLTNVFEIPVLNAISLVRTA